ncbi:MAG TPA: choice-of-anchor D domain-containing protein [Blastocatellia bacterium]|nr:choice-of-anchor D domain-containing protein [Blastocatellia bacterium]
MPSLQPHSILPKAATILVLLAGCLCSAMAQDNQAQQFTKSLSIEAKNMTLRYPEGWSLIQSPDPTVRELQMQVSLDKRSAVNEVVSESTGTARMQINIEPRLDHADALERLRHIAAEYSGSEAYLDIGGWPAYQRRYLAPLARKSRAATQPVEMTTRVTTAIAAGDQVIRIETFFPPGASEELAAQAELIGRSVSFAETGDERQTLEEVRMLRSSPPMRSSPYVPPLSSGVGGGGVKADPDPSATTTGKAPNRKGAATRRSKTSMPTRGTVKGQPLTTATPVAGAQEPPQGVRELNRPRERSATPRTGPQELPQELPETGLNRFVHSGVGELEVAISTNGQNIVIAANSGFSNSTNGGQTFTFRGGTPGPNNSRDGDPSLGVGASGAFYYGFIGFPDGTPAWNNQTGCSTGISVSTNGGASFPFRSNATLCPQMGAGVCFPDQEHIAADRFNPAGPGPGGGDQVYSAWRNFTPAMGMPTCRNIGSGFIAAMLTCSRDSANNWPTTRTLAGGADFPRVTVGQDGFVYVVYRNGGNINLEKYSSCANGLTLQAGFPQTIAAVTDVTCPVPGLDRCNDGNLLSSHMVAVDDQNANHVYAAYATNTAAGNENVVVRDSTNGGMSWPAARNVTLNSPVVGRRFMPWVATVGGAAHVSWYDRRAGVGGATNDLTDFFRGSAFLDGGGNLVAGPEIKVTQAPDPQCASGWTNTAPRATGDSESCSVQPQNAGVCKLNPIPMPDTSSNRRCDFSDCPGPMCPCNPGEVCKTGGGFPKYGDYNGIAAGAGRVITSWSSATPPPGLTPTPPAGINVYTSVDIVCCVPQIQIPSNPNFPTTCVGSSSVATLNVCNTGKADLEVSSITSSNAQFSVTTPSSGFPVIVSPDFCFPFEARFTPTSAGSKTTTLTVNSNDPVNPAVMRTFSAQGGQPVIVVNDPITFDKTCPGGVNNKTLTIGNSGSCDLIVTGITSSSAEFKVIGVVPFPLVIPPGDTRDVTIQFMPMGFTVDPMRMATLTIMSNDPVTPNKTVKVVGTVPPPVIQAAPDPLDFGEVCLNTSKTLPLVIRNAGECNLTVSGITFSSTEFKLVSPPAFPFVIPPGGSRTLMVSFMPVGATGPRMATMTINSDDPVTPMKVVTLKGVAPVSAIAISGSMDFGMVKVGMFKDQFLNISNTAPCDLLITLICEIQDDGPIQLPSTEFDVIAPVTPKLVPGGDTLPVQIRFKPQKKGPRTAKLLVFGFDPATSSILLKETFQLKGVGQ